MEKFGRVYARVHDRVGSTGFTTGFTMGFMTRDRADFDAGSLNVYPEAGTQPHGVVPTGLRPPDLFMGSGRAERLQCPNTET